MVDDNSQEESASNERDLAWWQRTIIYHVYVPSYYDTDGDGLGDLRGKSSYNLMSHSVHFCFNWFEFHFFHESMLRLWS